MRVSLSRPGVSSWSFGGSGRLLLAVVALTACGDDAGQNPSSATFDAGPADAQAAVDAVPGQDASTALDGFVLDSQDAQPTDAQPSDAAPDAQAPQEPLSFESTETTLDDGSILIEKVSYRSEGLRIFGQVCRPHPSLPQGIKQRVQIINHGGFSGIGDWNGGNCANLARQGWVVAESSYRGEDGSEGKVEVCLGEVTDVLRLTAIVAAQPYADPKRLLMSGISHGGCITTRAVQRGAPVQMAVDIFGPTDWAEAYAGWKAGIASWSLQSSNYQLLIKALEQATGGSPQQVPQEYARRSPRTFGADLDAAPLPFMIMQGMTDALVPPAQSCILGAASQGFQSFHVTTSGAVVTSAPAGCAPSNLSWLPGPRPTTSWPKDRYLMVYDDVGHNFEGAGTAILLADLNAFVAARFPK